MDRKLQLLGGVSCTISAIRSIVPGSSLADILMRLAIVDLTRATCSRWPRLSLVVVADDVQGTAFGSRAVVEKTSALACSFLVAGLSESGLPVSEPKVQLVGSEAAVCRRTARRCLPLREATARSVRNLGADFAGGRRILHRTRRLRIERVLKRARRFRILGRFGPAGLRVARTALGPAGLFAAAVTGILPSHVAQIRRAYHLAIVRRPTGRAATVDIALLDPTAEPLRQILALPVAWLAKELDSKSSPKLMLKQCIDKILPEQVKMVRDGKLSNIPRTTCGPVSSALSAAFRLGWSSTGRTSWQTLRGVQLDLAMAAPDSVRRIAEEDAETAAWKRAAARHSHLAHLDGSPYLDAARRLVSDRSVRTAAQRGMLKAFLSGKFFRFTRCRCGASFADPARCWAHWVWECPDTAEARELLKTPLHSVSGPSYPGLPHDFGAKLGSFLHTPWVQTALLPDPRQSDPPPADPEVVKWRLHPHDEPLFAGTCGGDGSCSIGGLRPSLAARAGWAVTEVYEEYGKQKRLAVGRQVAGTLPGPVQSAEGAELYALVFWLRHLDPSSPSTPRFVTDCERVYDGWHGRWDTLEAWTPHRDLWQAAAMLKEDARDDVEVHWTPGHARPDAQHSRGPPGRLG